MNSNSPELPTEAWTRLKEVLERFENAWKRGERPTLDDYLRGAAPAERHALLVELVQEDMHYRLEVGEAPRVEFYFDRFPELGGNPAVALDLIAAEYEQRRRREPALTSGEYDQRFPQWRPELVGRLNALPLHKVDPRQATEATAGTCIPLSNAETMSPAVAEACSLPLGEHISLAGAGNRDAIPGYEILKELGRGGMGVIYQARQLQLDRLVALKMILAGAHAGVEDLKRFRTEAESVARLQHPNIVQIYEVGESAGRPFFSLEFVAGGGLDRRLNGTPLPAGQAAALVATLARAIHAAHQRGIVHRDLKPANVLLTADGVPKITDFGLAKKLDDAASQTASGAVMGTPSYMAPEQAGGKSKEIGPAADVYALGAILYECLTGRPPFKAATALDTLMQVLSEEPVPPSRLALKVPPDLETICLKSLHKEPAKRYPSAETLADDLGRFLNNKPILARPVGRPERAWRWCMRNKAVASALAAAILILILGTGVSTGFAFWALDNARQARESARVAESREQEVRQEQEKTRQAFQAEARRRRQARQAWDALSGAVVSDLLARRKELEPEQKAFLEQALVQQEEFARDVGDDAESLLGAADGSLGVGNIQHRLRRDVEAEKAFRAAVALYERLKTSDPATALYRQRQVAALNNLGNLLQETDRPKEADEVLDRARKLAGEQTGGPQESLNALRALMNQALNREENDDLAGARARYQEVLNGLAKAEAGPAISEAALQLLGQCRTNLGSVLNELGRNPEAEEVLRKGIATTRLLIKHYPREAGYRSGLAKALHNYGSALEGNSKLPNAENAFREALQVEKALVEDYPGVPEHLIDLAKHADSLATCLRRSGQLRDAEALYREALVAATTAAKGRPTAIEFRNVEAGVRENLATLLAESGRPTEAEPAMREAVACWQGLARDFPNNPLLPLRVAGARTSLGQMLLVPGKYEAALAELDAVVRALEELQNRGPAPSGIERRLAWALAARAKAKMGLRRFANALTDCERGLKLNEPAKRLPLEFSRATCKAQTGKAAEAVEFLERIRKESGIPGWLLVESAQVFALGAAAAKEDPARTDRLAGQAIAQLREAAKVGLLKGSTAAEQLAKDPDLAGIHDRPDFHALLQVLRAN